jgi:hypothetical protein
MRILVAPGLHRQDVRGSPATHAPGVMTEGVRGLPRGGAPVAYLLPNKEGAHGSFALAGLGPRRSSRSRFGSLGYAASKTAEPRGAR